MLRWAAGVAIVLSWLGSNPVQAAGYIVSEIGPQAMGRGGAMVANPGDATAVWLNPAGVSNVKGMQLFVDTTLVHMEETFTRSCRPSCAPTPYERHYGRDVASVLEHPGARFGGFEGDVDDTSGLALGHNGDNSSVGKAVNKSPGRLVPFFSLAVNGELLGMEGLGLAVAAYGPNTGGVLFPKDGPQRYSVVESVPLEAIFQAALAYRFNRYLALGLALAFHSIGSEERLALSLDDQGREDRSKDVDVHLNIREDMIPSLAVGFSSNPFAGLEIGASFITGRNARATGPISVTPVDENALNGPGSLGIQIDDSHARAVGYFGMPPVARAAVRYNWAPWFDVEAAVVREFWSGFRDVRLEVNGLSIATNLPGVDTSLPPTIMAKEWQDSVSLRLGGDMNVVPGILALRVGTFVENSAIPDKSMDVSVADGNKLGVSYGFSLGYFGLKLTGAYQHIFVQPREVTRSIAVSQNPLTRFPLNAGNTVVGLGRYDISYDLMSAGITVDVGEVALRIKSALTGDPDWWKAQGAENRMLVDAAHWLQDSSNL